MTHAYAPYQQCAEPAYSFHYFRICNLYMGPNFNHWRRWKQRGLDEPGLLAYAHLRKWAGKDNFFDGVTPKWSSGFARLDATAQALQRRPHLLTRQAA